MPPRMTIASMVADSVKVKLSGLTKPCRVGEKSPRQTRDQRAKTIGRQLHLPRLMPIAAQAISSSRNASHARPIGKRRNRAANQPTRSARNRMT